MDRTNPTPPPDEILRFWLEETDESLWYKQDDAFDAEIRRRFLPAWQAAHDAGRPPFEASARESLASLILLDQFPRNMFRGDGRSFATDAMALALSRRAIARGHDLEIEPPGRQFFFLPFLHAEDLDTQDEGIAHFQRAMPDEDNLLHARAHREIIRRFGRFPYRNDALGRATTEAERAFLEAGSYGSVVRELQGGNDEGS